ncbi:sensor histidine kinase [Streptomyces lunaelactis]|uniref:sensor histidine kinase n=1 Tax=Streptomyces lunaelactis TaxID=1535768 RepID=UPI001584A939|nr:sensor histidine kinase [Streptomyces lunaelactis]NUK27212.1 sensor histidine kinase [Streptomyces lunaelactis]NUK50714.1 sensor histidine kinase [Streptomyces lunaelactis]NUK65175.1 sensor histidine kinase [Streptomyces lunaelactis]NUL13495.1 sensor histidine kinase [Streptomyces lunaelactis]NUL26339.1 sensor histidine kinase [Streptomyces lunaelactis]
MATNALRSLWAEPRPTNAPDRRPRDWALVAVLICWSLLEVVLRQDLAPRPLLLLAVLAVLGPLLWRRTHPLVAVAVSFGTLTIVDIVRILTGSQGALLNSISAALILAYALFRWGSGREAASGLGVILLWLAITNVADTTSLADSVAAYGFFLFAAVLGAAIRYHTKILIRDIDQAKAREREQLARELHDTVAHHVSGIAIQAQAGRAIAASHPERAIEALAIIEDAATRTLTELRAIVGVLRATQDTEFAPQPGVAEVEQLATDGQTRPCVEVTLFGEFDDLSPAVGAAIYRLAQESITNARRHARHATQVTVAVTGDADQVRLTIDDDGSAAGGRAPAGYGLVGMRERASLLGGTFHAGPAAERGWRVEAVLPRTGTPR